MPDQKFTSWVHGSSMQIEYAARITSVRHCGPFVRIEGARGQNTWVHFPIPTPAVVNGANRKSTPPWSALGPGLTPWFMKS